MLNKRKGRRTSSSTRASLASYSSGRQLVIFNLLEDKNENAYKFLRLVILSCDWNTWRTEEHLDIWVRNLHTGTNVICIVEFPAWQIERAQMKPRLRFLTTSDWGGPMLVPGV